ncbi:MAG: DUF1275 domain-containing protein [Lachnospiraceae bacterium]|nr:DUF1275 domain-containing protein [Lachnospiraceae bacterium]
MKIRKAQSSESFLVSAILALSGGFQDAYTYNTRDQVFSNAQTGNVVLMSQHFMMQEWLSGLHYLVPLVAFALGVVVSEQLRTKYKNAKKIHWRQLVVLIEAVLLFLVGFLSYKHNMTATMIVSFTCAMQVQAFRKIKGNGFATTMCIGNLRSGTDALSSLVRTKEKPYAKKVLYYYGIIFVFAIGAGIGGICSIYIGIKCIWVSCILLMLACIAMRKEYR